MIKAVIFSKDRAFQLSALLRSIKRYCNIHAKIEVLYTASTPFYQMGYDILKDRMKVYPDIVFKKEVNLKNDFVNAFDIDYSYSVIYVDDMIFFKDYPIIGDSCQSIFNVFNGGDVCCFSLRIGKNIKDPDVNIIDVDERIMKWQWRENHGRPPYGYPISTDGHIYPTSTIKAIATGSDYITPNKFEVRSQKYKKGLETYMASFQESLCISMPVNLVSSESNCASGNVYGYTIEELNAKYLQGMILDFTAMDFGNIKNTHKEVEFKFRTYAN